MQQSTSCLIPAVSGTSEEDPMVMVPSPPPILQAPPAESEKKHQNGQSILSVSNETETCRVYVI